MSFWSENPAITAAAVGGLAGLVGGVVSAISKGFFDERVQEKRLRFERDNARQQKLIDAQSALLDELANVCWKWRYNATRLAYYGSVSDGEDYQNALKIYRDNIWTDLNQIRFMGTRAGRLFSKSALDRVEAFYGDVDDVDQDIEQAVSEGDPSKQIASFKKVYPIVRDKVRMEIADLILNLARGVDLVPRK